ncbi:MAG: orotidine-5'-phosphate decarboxylase [Fimbriimonadales bacterium]|nr:orotidine-5'-phosphate decarboxylase [Fimbriimonadales bacterium]MDW8051293.1 orotidine-5'-phosphate decarboxylase [Armatimonadota bacterium]
MGNGSVAQRTILALDTPNIGQACDWVQQYRDKVYAYKVGSVLHLAHGLPVIHTLHEAGAERIFLDLKFHDIPNVVAQAVRQAAEFGVWMLTLHVMGGVAMLEAARTALSDLPHRPLLIGVTVLTSLDAPALHAMGIPRAPRAQTLRLAKLALQAGLDGVVASPLEVRLLRRHLPPEFLIITPGVRPVGSPAHDQKRVATPEQALRWGADFVVMGRALLRSKDAL